MAVLDSTYVRDTLRRLTHAKPDVFGANSHGFKLNPPLNDGKLAEFEEKHRIRLPDDYRRFIGEVGNGGAGPYYGVFPLGYMDEGFDLVPWDKPHSIVAELAAEFRYRDAWNDLTGRPPDELAVENEQEYERQLNAFEERYFASSLMNGTFPICHMGCALRGVARYYGRAGGRLWRDGRADYSGLSPVLLKNGSPAEFSVWYMEWSEDALTALHRAR